MDPASVFREYMRLQQKRETHVLSPQEKARWSELKALLSGRFRPPRPAAAPVAPKPPAKSDTRESVRVPASFPTSYACGSERGHGVVTNLSRGGLFLSSSRLLPIGSLLELGIRVERPGRGIEVLGKVVSHNMGLDLSADRGGMGLCFTRLRDRKLLDELYERTLRRAVVTGKD